MRIFIDEDPVEVVDGASVQAALAAWDAAVARRVESGTAHVTDGVGRPVAPDSPLAPGAILRVVRSRRR